MSKRVTKNRSDLRHGEMERLMKEQKPPNRRMKRFLKAVKKGKWKKGTRP